MTDQNIFIIRAFQSTLPVRGATYMVHVHPDARKRFQSTLPVRGATQKLIAIS